VLGDVLVTISTGEMSEESAAERGLVPTHAYAVIGMYFFLISHMR
jgi:hypothetical protein